MVKKKAKFDRKKWCEETGYYKKYYEENKETITSSQKKYLESKKGKETRKKIELDPKRKDMKNKKQVNKRIETKLAKDFDNVVLTAEFIKKRGKK